MHRQTYFHCNIRIVPTDSRNLLLLYLAFHWLTIYTYISFSLIFHSICNFSFDFFHHFFLPFVSQTYCGTISNSFYIITTIHVSNNFFVHLRIFTLPWFVFEKLLFRFCYPRVVLFLLPIFVHNQLTIHYWDLDLLVPVPMLERIAQLLLLSECHRQEPNLEMVRNTL